MYKALHLHSCSYFLFQIVKLHTVTMTDEHAAYGVPLFEPRCKLSKLKASKDDTDHGSDEHYASEAQFLQYKTKGTYYVSSNL